MTKRKPSTPKVDLSTYVCPIYRTRQQSGIAVAESDDVVVTGHETSGRCGHVHVLDLEDGQWVIDGKRPTT